jgi:PEP-CTERM motif
MWFGTTVRRREREIQMPRTSLIVTAAIALGWAAAPAAAAVNAPVPSNAYITFRGIDWAWASACSPTGCTFGGAQLVAPIDLSYQGGQGWRLPTAADWARAPVAADFLFAGANVPDGGTALDGSGASFGGAIVGSAGACAAPWFSNYLSCDYNDGVIGAVWGIPNSPYAGIDTVDTWLVRGSAVPEPASWAMLIAGFGLTGAMLRRRRHLVA